MPTHSTRAHSLSLDSFCHALAAKDKRLRIYRDNGNSTLAHTLSNNFPLLRTYIGEPTFTALARTYRDWSVDNDSNLNTYGEYLPFFISEQRHSNKQLPYTWDALADLAQLELAIIQLYYGKATHVKLTLQDTLKRAFGAPVLHSLDKHHPYVIRHENTGSTRQLDLELRGVKIWLSADQQAEQLHD